MSDKNDFYEKLKERLDATTTFPSKYLYKFIVPADKLKVKEIESIFNYGGAIIDTKSSKKGKYTSVSILIIIIKTIKSIKTIKTQSNNK